MLYYSDDLLGSVISYTCQVVCYSVSLSTIPYYYHTPVITATSRYGGWRRSLSLYRHRRYIQTWTLIGCLWEVSILYHSFHTVVFYNIIYLTINFAVYGFCILWVWYLWKVERKVWLKMSTFLNLSAIHGYCSPADQYIFLPIKRLSSTSNRLCHPIRSRLCCSIECRLCCLIETGFLFQ